jgi:flagellar protein FliO/FliZ
MMCLPQQLRAAARASLLAVGFAMLAFADPAAAFKPALKGGGESTPLSTGSSADASHQSSSGPSIVRTIVGLLIVIAVIWGLTWILRQFKSGREARTAGSGLSSLASLSLGSGRSVHLVRAGSEYLIIGSAEQGVVPIQRYTEAQARESGLLDQLDGGDSPGDDAFGASSGRRSLRGGARGGTRSTPPATTAGALLDRLREWTVRR